MVFKVGDRVTVQTSLADPSRLRAHSHALVRRVDGDDHWVGHDQDDPELFGPFPASRLRAGWGRSPREEAAVRGMLLGVWL